MWVMNNSPKNSKTLDATISDFGAKAISETKNGEMRYVNFSFLTSFAYGYFSCLQLSDLNLVLVVI
jgi:hypothetical protein